MSGGLGTSDLTSLTGDANFSNIEIGRDCLHPGQGPQEGQGMQDFFGQQADVIDINNANQVAWSVSAASSSSPA
ncbi:DUF6230 family protein [Streptomyces thioluteus]